MVAINFQERFSYDVEDGIKTQTIREKARCKPGDKLQLYTGMRTKKCRKLLDAVCTKVTPISIDYCTMQLNDRNLYSNEAEAFARADGFADYTAMTEFFDKLYGILPFNGFVIEWNPKESDNERE